MKIWVDADACPNVIKEIIFRAAERKQINTILVANQSIRTPPSSVISTVRVPAGFDVADNHIVQAVEKGDLVIFDVGCEYNQYVSDIGRTFPVSGKFLLLSSTILCIWVSQFKHFRESYRFYLPYIMGRGNVRTASS